MAKKGNNKKGGKKAASSTKQSTPADSWLPTHLVKAEKNKKKQEEERKQREEQERKLKEERKQREEQERKQREEEERKQREEQERKQREEEERKQREEQEIQRKKEEELQRKKEEEREKLYAQGYFKPGVSVYDKLQQGIERDEREEREELERLKISEEERKAAEKKYTFEERKIMRMAKETKERRRRMNIDHYKGWVVAHTEELTDLCLELDPPDKGDFYYHAYMTYDRKLYPLFPERGDNESALCDISYHRQYPFFTREAPTYELSEKYVEWLSSDYTPTYHDDEWSLA